MLSSPYAICLAFQLKPSICPIVVFSNPTVERGFPYCSHEWNINFVMVLQLEFGGFQTTSPHHSSKEGEILGSSRPWRYWRSRSTRLLMSVGGFEAPMCAVDALTFHDRVLYPPTLCCCPEGAGSRAITKILLDCAPPESTREISAAFGRACGSRGRMLLDRSCGYNGLQ